MASFSEIRARLAKGEKAADIAALYDLNPSSVDDIRVKNLGEPRLNSPCC